MPRPRWRLHEPGERILEHLQQPRTEDTSDVARAPVRSVASADVRGTPEPLLFDDKPSWTSQQGDHDKFDHTVSLPGWLMRELGHIDPRGVRRIGVRIVEVAPGFPSSDGTRPNQPRQLAFD